MSVTGKRVEVFEAVALRSSLADLRVKILAAIKEEDPRKMVNTGIEVHGKLQEIHRRIAELPDSPIKREAAASLRESAEILARDVFDIK